MADFGWSLQNDLPDPTFGRDAASALMMQMSLAANPQTQMQTQSTGSPAAAAGSGQAAAAGAGGGGAGAPPQTATAAPPPAYPDHPVVPINAGPPVEGDHWQGGQSNGRWVDSSYQTDANGNPLTAEQQKYWRDQDVLRANASTREHDGYLAYKAAQSANENKATNFYYRAQDKMYHLYNPTGGTDGKGGWETYGVDDMLANHMSDAMKKQHDEAWYRDNANTLDTQHYDSTYNDALADQRQNVNGNARFKYQAQYF